MCGIGGIITLRKDFVDKQPLMRKMATKLSHRGPDGEGFFQDSKVGLFHKRLAIIDLINGRQPMSNEDKSVWITFNGCIYNYLELRRKLISKGHKFKTYSDTEVIIHAWEEYSTDALKLFNGMFSFCIYDISRKKIFCARDRLGIKPFYYYYKKDDLFLFSSEIKSLFEYEEVKKTLNEKALHEYIIFQYTLKNKTLFKDIYKLEPGHYLIIDLSSDKLNMRINQYWDIDYTIDNLHTQEYFVDRLKTLIEDSVRLRLRSDVALGTHLSGGLDSSTIATVSSTLLTTPITTFTGAFYEGKEYDETYWAKFVAKKINAIYKEIYIKPQDFIRYIKNIIYLMDEPEAGPGLFPQYIVSKLASENVKVVLGGQGGDEIFVGYTRYFIVYFEYLLKKRIFSEEVDKHSIQLEEFINNLEIFRKYVPLMKYYFSDKSIFDDLPYRYFRIMDRSDNFKNLLNFEIDKGFVFSEFFDIFNKYDTDLLNKMLYFDLKTHLQALLHVEDRTSMGVSLESRVPLLDHRLVEFVSHIPVSIKVKEGEPKYLFKQVIKNILPSEVVNRKDKMGFPVPLNLWYKSHLKDFIKDIILSNKNKISSIYDTKKLEAYLNNLNSFSRVLWGILSLQLWFDNFFN